MGRVAAVDSELDFTRYLFWLADYVNVSHSGTADLTWTR